MDLTLNQEEYEALIALAAKGRTAQQRRELESFLASIEKRNGVTRHKLWVQWQEADTPLLPSVEFPDKWPPELRHYIELLSRPITRVDVDAVLKLHARDPVTVLVTPDPAALVGWTKLEDFFVQ